MSPLDALRRWRAFRRLLKGPAPFVHRYDPAHQRDHQRRAARLALTRPEMEIRLERPIPRAR